MMLGGAPSKAIPIQYTVGYLTRTAGSTLQTFLLQVKPLASKAKENSGKPLSVIDGNNF